MWRGGAARQAARRTLQNHQLPALHFDVIIPEQFSLHRRIGSWARLSIVCAVCSSAGNVHVVLPSRRGSTTPPISPLPLSSTF